MNAAAGLLNLCRNAMIPEPIYFIDDEDGNHHLSFDNAPSRTVIDVHGLARLIGVTVTVGDALVIIECDGLSLVYDRVGMTITGDWVCNLRVGRNAK